MVRLGRRTMRIVVALVLVVSIVVVGRQLAAPFSIAVIAIAARLAVLVVALVNVRIACRVAIMVV